MIIRVATRGSRLSLVQTQSTLEYIKRAIPNLRFKLVIVKTRGDIYRDRPIHEVGGKGIFEKEVNMAVLKGEADIAVHSMKDLPSSIDPRLDIVMVPPRGPISDVIVPREGALDPFNLPPGAIVGTSSIRRKSLLLHFNPHIDVKPIRGNIDTRLKKLDEGGYNAIILAEAGLVRLGIKREYSRLPIDKFTPAPGQGLIAVVALRDSRLAGKLSRLSDKRSLQEAIAERAFLGTIHGGCHAPVGGVAVHVASIMIFNAVVVSPSGSRAVWVRIRGDPSSPEALGRRAGDEINAVIDRVLEDEE